MRFLRLVRPPGREWTPRRVAIAKRRVAEEKAKLGMFADQFKVETVEERIASIDRGDEAWHKEFRRFRAEGWLKGRRALHLLPKEQRLSIIAEWDKAPYPGSPEYFLDFLTRKGIKIE